MVKLINKKDGGTDLMQQMLLYNYMKKIKIILKERTYNVKITIQQ